MLPAYSEMTMDMVQDALNPAADVVSAQLQTQMTALESNPDPSPTDLAIFQANMQIYTSIMEMNSSVTESMGSMMKQIATNIGN